MRLKEMNAATRFKPLNVMLRASMCKKYNMNEIDYLRKTLMNLNKRLQHTKLENAHGSNLIGICRY